MLRRLPYFILLILCACVPQKKLDALLAEKAKLEADKAEVDERLAISEDSNEQLEKRVNALLADTAQLGQRYRLTEEELSKLKKEYNALDELNRQVTSNRNELNETLQAEQDRLSAAEERLEVVRRRNEELSQNLRERERRVSELEKVLADKEKAVSDLKALISDALTNFEESDLSVNIKNGKVYVSLQEKLLFGSGSIAVDAKGQTALKQLAGALKDKPDINVMVEGHTDDVPISKTSTYLKDNWDLSVLRATSILKILTNAGLPESQIVAAGRGEFSPVDTNETKEGRQKNRRTEIILTPKLDELFQILEAN